MPIPSWENTKVKDTIPSFKSTKPIKDTSFVPSKEVPKWNDTFAKSAQVAISGVGQTFERAGKFIIGQPEAVKETALEIGGGIVKWEESVQELKRKGIDATNEALYEAYPFKEDEGAKNAFDGAVKTLQGLGRLAMGQPKEVFQAGQGIAPLTIGAVPAEPSFIAGIGIGRAVTPLVTRSIKVLGNNALKKLGSEKVAQFFGTTLERKLVQLSDVELMEVFKAQPRNIQSAMAKHNPRVRTLLQRSLPEDTPLRPVTGQQFKTITETAKAKPKGLERPKFDTITAKETEILKKVNPDKEVLQDFILNKDGSAKLRKVIVDGIEKRLPESEIVAQVRNIIPKAPKFEATKPIIKAEPLELEAKKYKTAEEFVKKIANDSGVSDKAKLKTIELSKITGTDYAELDTALKTGKLTEKEANDLIGREELVAKGKRIVTPISVGLNKDGSYYLIGGNNRVAQAIVNGEKTITAISNDFKEGQNLFDIWNKAQEKPVVKPTPKPVPKPIEKPITEPLELEAKKYKTAEEFVNKQPKAFHGSPNPLKSFSNKKGGVFFTNEYADATGFAGTPDNVYEGYLNFKKPLVIDAKGAKWNELNTKYGKSTQEVISNAQKEGYDGITFKNIVDNIGDTAGFGGESTIQYAYKPQESFVNKSQLTDIWNKAQEKPVTPKPVKNVSQNTKNMIQSVYEKNKNLFDLRKPEGRAKILQQMSRQVYEGMEKDPSFKPTATTKNEVSKLLKRFDETGKIDETALQNLRRSSFAKTPPRLPTTPPSRVDVPKTPPRVTPKPTKKPIEKPIEKPIKFEQQPDKLAAKSLKKDLLQRGKDVKQGAETILKKTPTKALDPIPGVAHKFKLNYVSAVRNNPKAVEDYVAMRKMKDGSKRPAIRESGVFAPKGFETQKFRDIGGLMGGKSFNLRDASLAFDDLSPQEVAKLQKANPNTDNWGEMTKLSYRADEKVAQQINFLNERGSVVRQLAKENNVKINRKTGVQLFKALEGKTEHLPKEIISLSKSVRNFFNETKAMANTQRVSMGKKPIGHISNYAPHLQKISFWRNMLANPKTEITDNFDYIIPNAKKNPHALPRESGMENLETNAWKLAEDYSSALSDDIFTSPIIEELKAANSVIKGRGFYKMSGLIEKHVRENIVGKAAGIDTNLGITEGTFSRGALQKLNQARTMSALAGNIMWSMFTQPASLVGMTLPRAGGLTKGLQNTLGGAFDFATNTEIKNKIKRLPTFQTKSKLSIGTTGTGDLDRTGRTIMKSKIETFNKTMSVFADAMEYWLTGTSAAAGYRHAKMIGLTGINADRYADWMGGVTQSRYNKEARPMILNNISIRALAPFQTFAFELYRYAKTLAGGRGGMPIKGWQRLNQALMLVAGVYAYNKYREAVTGRPLTSVGSAVPLVGGLVDESINEGRRALGLKAKRVGSGRAPIAPHQDVTQMIRAVGALVKHSNIQPMRKELVKWSMGFGGVAGASTVNRLIDGMIANVRGYEVSKSGEWQFRVKGTDKLIAPVLGSWSTRAGIKEIKRRNK